MLAVAVVGWLTAVILAVVLVRRGRPSGATVSADPVITHLLLVDAKGWPESLRLARGPAPKELHRAHGRGPAQRYPRIGLAAIYQGRG